MIGVVTNEDEHPAVVEFFELFKTPWEFYRPGAQYDVLLCSNSPVPENNARLLLLYGTQRQAFELYRGIKTHSASERNSVVFRGQRLPIYGSCLLFNGANNQVITHEGTSFAAGVSMVSGAQAIVRVGFDLFEEVRHLLTLGQPKEFASIPTLELHISLLRDLIIRGGVTLAEIPPVPAGHRFIVCLTHDLDHPGVCYHKCDHTMFGFLYRALVGSFINFCRGRRSLRQVAISWKAAFSLPLVFAGLAKDFWDQLDQYLDLERGLGSTFFVIPTKGDTGVDSHGHRRARRASRYALADIAEELEKLIAANCEIAVHGIDAWRDSTKGCNERESIQQVTGTSEVGVRMHWLYFDSQAPRLIEKAGFAYDSTAGYNETIGYRAGTAQVFKHLNADRLLELPLHIMDTALFYPSYMNLLDKQADAAIRPLIENAMRLGGVLTINWHDRSLAPERLWIAPYRKLLDQLKSRNAWFATAGDAVSWFNKRRSSRIDNIAYNGNTIRTRVCLEQNNSSLPPLNLRVHTPARRDRAFVDVTVDESTEVEIPV
jgi:peptidoglycan/xylan/chitin deacetylase (PgdA/CDA1 family)